MTLHDPVQAVQRKLPLARLNCVGFHSPVTMQRIANTETKKASPLGADLPHSNVDVLVLVAFLTQK